MEFGIRLFAFLVTFFLPFGCVCQPEYSGWVGGWSGNLEPGDGMESGRGACGNQTRRPGSMVG